MAGRCTLLLILALCVSCKAVEDVCSINYGKNGPLCSCNPAYDCRQKSLTAVPDGFTNINATVMYVAFRVLLVIKFLVLTVKAALQFCNLITIQVLIGDIYKYSVFVNCNSVFLFLTSFMVRMDFALWFFLSKLKKKMKKQILQFCCANYDEAKNLEVSPFRDCFKCTVYEYLFLTWNRAEVVRWFTITLNGLCAIYAILYKILSDVQPRL